MVIYSETSALLPWHYFSRHPFKREFFHCLDETDWKGWRPERPEQLLKQWWDCHYLPLHAHLKTRIRSVKPAYSS